MSTCKQLKSAANPKKSNNNKKKNVAGVFIHPLSLCDAAKVNKNNS